MTGGESLAVAAFGQVPDPSQPRGALQQAAVAVLREPEGEGVPAIAQVTPDVERKRSHSTR